MNILLSIALAIISLPFLSRIWGRIHKMKHPRFLVKRIIKLFHKNYQINMEEYEGEVEDYNSLCSFFTRRLDPTKRPLKPVENVIVSPADGRLTEVQTIYTDEATQVKGKTYRVSEMIGENIDFSKGWHVAVIYLSPSNYHRYHYPLTGKITRYLHTGARLYPVNNVGLNMIDRLFVQNERIVTEIRIQDDDRTQSCYIVAVGATFVGSIKMEFITERKKRHQWIPVNLDVRQLDEMGRFEIGSTIVMVIPKEFAEPIEGKRGESVNVGDPIFSLK